MEFKDLRVGNWVEYNNKPTQVCGMTEKEVWIYNPHYNKRLGNQQKEIISNKDNIKPIKITDKFMTDNGFTINTTVDYCIPCWKKKGVELEIYPDNMLLYSDNINIRYIHELQNLLSVIGIDDFVILDVKGRRINGKEKTNEESF